MSHDETQAFAALLDKWDRMALAPGAFGSAYANCAYALRDALMVPKAPDTGPRPPVP